MPESDERTSDARTVAAIVLGAGHGTRFGPGDKLAQTLDGRALAHHVLETIDAFHWGARILVCREGSGWASAFDEHGFLIRINNQSDRGMLGSLHLGVDAAAGFMRVVVFLADMPRINPRHISQLLALSHTFPDRAIASCADTYRGPPAIIPTDCFQELPLSGEGGAKSLLHNALFIETAACNLVDVDTADDLRALSP